MYAVIKTGGKQYRVNEGDVLKIEQVEGESGDSVSLGTVIALGGDSLNTDASKLAKATVSAEILEQGKGEKVVIFKKKRRHNYRRKLGHRQLQSVVRITGIAADGNKAAEKKAPAKAKAAPKAEAKTDTPAAKAAAPKTEAKKAPAKKPAAKKAAPKKTED